jgi:predicted HAD superfamily Cof-like phosphohydrolase
MLKAPCVSLRKNARKWFSRFDPVSSMNDLVSYGLPPSKLRLPAKGRGETMMEGTNFELVSDFMYIFNQEVREYAELPDRATQELRLDLIHEEVEELEEGIRNADIVEIADALTDILYVVYGAGHAFGIDLDDCFAEVQRSNMSKLGPDGKPMYREDGKVMKGPNYSEPDLTFIL